jgi:hypothetical protein
MYFSADKWPEFKKLGRKQFVLRYGVLGWGLPVAIGWSLSMAHQNGWNQFLFFLIPSLIVFPLGGVLFGRFLWWWVERKNASSPVAE